MSEGGTIKSVSPEATDRALRRIVGDLSLDMERYTKYRDHAEQYQPHFWGGMNMLGELYEYAAEAAGDPVPVERHVFVGGALMYLASREEQAEIDRTTVPEISDRAVRQGFQFLFLRTKDNEQLLESLSVAVSREFSDRDVRRMAHAEVIELPALNEELLDRYQASREASPFATEIDTLMRYAVTLAIRNMDKRAGEFRHEEVGFYSVLKRWTAAIEPGAERSQILGATAARAVIDSNKQTHRV